MNIANEMKLKQDVKGIQHSSTSPQSYDYTVRNHKVGGDGSFDCNHVRLQIALGTLTPVSGVLLNITASLRKWKYSNQKTKFL